MARLLAKRQTDKVEAITTASLSDENCVGNATRQNVIQSAYPLMVVTVDMKLVAPGVVEGDGRGWVTATHED